MDSIYNSALTQGQTTMKLSWVALVINLVWMAVSAYAIWWIVRGLENDVKDVKDEIQAPKWSPGRIIALIALCVFALGAVFRSIVAVQTATGASFGKFDTLSSDAFSTLFPVHRSN